MKKSRWIWIVIGNLLALLILLSEAKAQYKGHIYGKVKTADQQYEGFIRLGKEEAFWHDFFNAAKLENPYYEVANKQIPPPPKKPGSTWVDINFDFNSIWMSSLPTQKHQFSCQFGDIKSMSGFSSARVTIELKNGETVKLDGEGYNDIGTTIYVEDYELGLVSIRWDRLRNIEFFEAPSGKKSESGRALFGTVETFRKGSYTGFIQWDHDERLGEDRLDGDSPDGKMAIPFKEINYIEKKGNGSMVILHSGRELFMVNSNDVNEGNRGIIVWQNDGGQVDIPWRYFKSLTLEKNAPEPHSYKKYSSPKGIYGTVFTHDGKEISGRIIYDVDEEWEFESLDAKDDFIKYEIPLRTIQSIVPKNNEFAMVTTKNGNQVFLGGSRDVGRGHNGLLIYQKGIKDPIYMPWADVAEVIFND